MKKIILVILVMAFATAAYAFAFSGTISAGNGSKSGYAVTNVIYTYDTANPSIITYVDFDISPAISQVSVSLVSGGALTDCGVLIADGTHAHCPVNVAIASADMLRIATEE